MRTVLVVAAAFFAIGATAANADPIQIDGAYTIQYTAGIGNGPSFTPVLKTDKSTNTSTTAAFTELLSVGKTTAATKFFAVTPAGSCGHCQASKNHNTASGTISVSFKFDSPILSSSTLSDSAAYIANYTGDTDSVTWNSPATLVVNFVSGAILDINLINASDWTIYPKITFDLVKGPTTTNPPPVPEPASYLLFGAGLFALNLMMLRNRRKATIAA